MKLITKRIDVRLDYLTLGQSTSAVSPGATVVNGKRFSSGVSEGELKSWAESV